MASPNDITKKAKVPIGEPILCQCTTDNKPIFISVTKNYNLAGYEAFYIKLCTKQGMDFGDCPAGYLLYSFREAKDEICKDFSSVDVDAAQVEV